jgi:hypothetical protein
MFPLARDPITGLLARDPETGELLGCVDEGNEFMDSEVSIGKAGDEITDVREAMDVSWLGWALDDDEAGGVMEVELHGQSPVERRGRWRIRRHGTGQGQVKYKVRELSRLWRYRNGRSPKEVPPLLLRDANGITRMATL